MNDKQANSAITNESSYTGGVFDATISNGYSYADFERDMKTCHELILAIDSSNVEEIVRLAEENPESEKALGRATSYMERNYPKELI